MKPSHAVRALSIGATVLVLGACGDTARLAGPDSDIPEPLALERPGGLMAFDCNASTQTRTVRCVSPSGGSLRGPDDGLSAVIVGGQNEFVRLTSSNIGVVADTFAFDVTVTNLIPQPLGTTGGASADPAGVRVFFNDGPTSSGAGSVSVVNPDGTGVFTASDQPYFQYPGILARGATSAVKRWQIQFSPEVTDFTFTLYVAAEVQYPDGYIDGTPYVLTLNPSEVRTLPGTVRDVVGRSLTGEVIEWNSAGPSIAAVGGAQVTAGAGRGITTLTATAGARPGLFTTAVSVCEATVVTSGTSLPSSISGEDCFSSYGSNDGRPTTSYYADLYRVALTAGQTVTITLDSGDDLDTYLLLAAPVTGVLVGGNDDDDEGILGVGSRLTYTAVESGVHVIEASTFNGLDTGTYTLGVTIS